MTVGNVLSRFGKVGLVIMILMLLASPPCPLSHALWLSKVFGACGAQRGPFRKAECEDFNSVMREAVRLTLAKMDPPIVLAAVVPGLYAGGREGLFIIKCVEIVEKSTVGSTKQ